MQYYCDENVWGYVTAAKMYYWKKTGYRYGDPVIALGSASLFSQKPSLPRRIYDRLRNEHPLNCVNLTDDICAEYCAYIDAHHIRYIYGYAAAIYMFALYLKEHRIDVKGIRGVFTTSENLTDNYRTAIEEAFHCKVMDCYGARDAGITAYEIHPHCYNIGYNTIVEIENEIDVNMGSVVCTNFLNYSFPLLRYQFGDEAEICPENDVGDYNGQQFKRILGRTSHVLRLENHHKLTATGISMIMKEFDVAAFDIQKTGTNEVLLRIQIIPERFTEEQEALIIKTLKKYLGEDCTLTVERVPEFEPNKNGKRTYFMV
jgi:phenylacetate-CoA ligase